MKKILCSLLLSASLGLIAFVGSNNHNTASAAPNAQSSYWFKARKVTVKHTITAYKVKVANISANDYFIDKKVLKPGTKVFAQNGGASWTWLVNGDGMSNNSNHFWVLKTSSSSWIK